LSGWLEKIETCEKHKEKGRQRERKREKKDKKRDRKKKYGNIKRVREKRKREERGGR
jgi:hypothetical protein